jgi:hypothetical protein
MISRSAFSGIDVSAKEGRTQPLGGRKDTVVSSDIPGNHDGRSMKVADKKLKVTTRSCE